MQERKYVQHEENDVRKVEKIACSRSVEEIANQMEIDVIQLLKMTQSRSQYRAFVDRLRPTSKRRVR